MADEEVIAPNSPTGVKTFKIFLDGEEMNAKYRVELIVVQKELNRMPFARVSIIDGSVSDRKFEISDSGEFDPGKAIEIQAGYGGEDETIFKGVIVRQGVRMAKGGKSSLLKIEAKDEYAGLCIGRKSAYFYKSLDSDIIGDVLGTHKKNYEANVTRKYELKNEIEATKVEHDEMVQYYCSDWDFILTRAEKNGMLVNVSDGMFKVATPNLDAEPTLKLTMGATMFEFESELDSMSQYNTVESSSWNLSDQDVVKIDSDEPKLGSQGKLTGSDLSKVLGIDSLAINHSGSVIDKELQAWADAKLLRARLARLRGRVKCQGISLVHPGDVVELIGVGDHYSGKVFVSATRHVISKQNWEVDIQFGLEEDWFSNREDIVDSKASGLVPAVNGLQIGVVTQIEEDPDSEFRMLVRTPLISDKDDGIWARVAQLDAGNKRGTYFRPEIGDEVVLGYLNSDPRDPVVLGSLNSSKNPAPFTPSDDNDEKGIVTRSEMKLSFDDKDKIIYIQTANDKNRIRLDEKEKGIYIEDQHGNKIEMTSKGILIESASNISFVAQGDITMEGVNISGEAKAEVKFEGKAGAEISTSGIAVLKGSLVQIN
ncbi:MAG: type VI secretion system tip protein VgrG [Flavobacteriales bacterium]|nr:type VI secretion system tip protein VgrG [Flavobacteriales bacterium]